MKDITICQLLGRAHDPVAALIEEGVVQLGTSVLRRPGQDLASKPSPYSKLKTPAIIHFPAGVNFEPSRVRRIDITLSALPHSGCLRKLQCAAEKHDCGVLSTPPMVDARYADHVNW